MKTFAIPDLHGEYGLMLSALDIIYSSEDSGTIVFLGDYVDRGKKSAHILQHLMKEKPKDGWSWVTLMGNHEDMMADDSLKHIWKLNGGNKTIKSFYSTSVSVTIREAKQWVKSLHLYYEDEHRVYVHAACDPNKPLAKQEKGLLLWERYYGINSGYFDKHVVHGHTPQRDGPELLSKRTNLDCGAVSTGHLCVGVFDDDTQGGPVEILNLHKGEQDE